MKLCIILSLLFLLLKLSAADQILVGRSKAIIDDLYKDRGLFLNHQEKAANIWDGALRTASEVAEDKIDSSLSNVLLKEKFLMPLVILKMNNEILYQATIAQVNTFTDTKTIYSPDIKQKFMTAIRKYIDHFSLLVRYLKLPIIGSTNCDEKVCNQDYSDRLSLLIHNFLTKTNENLKTNGKFSEQNDDAEIAFHIIVSEAGPNLSYIQNELIYSFKKSLIQQFTGSRAATVLSIYTEKFEPDTSISRFLLMYFENAKDSCTAFEDLSKKTKKPEVLAQLLFFLLSDASSNALRKSFQYYLTTKDQNEKTSNCDAVFLDFLLSIKRSGNLEKIFSKLPDEKRKKYIELIKQKVNFTPSLKTYLNPFYSFISSNKGKISLFAASFIAFYVGYLKKILHRAKVQKNN